MQVLHQLPRFADPKILGDWETMDDCGIYLITDNLAIVQTIDCLTPIADDPYIFGQIVAANSLSDVYAMGAQPLTALSFISFPVKEMEKETIRKILAGLFDKVKEAGAVILGGHTLKDSEVKCGLAVTGIVEPNKIVTNSNAQVGDKLILTKPLGIGVITTAAKGNLAPSDVVERANHLMTQLNKVALEEMLKIGVNSATDVTGFGLLGHALEMARASGVNFRIFMENVPIIEGASLLAKDGLFPEGSLKNLAYVKPRVDFSSAVSQEERLLLADAQTSGGLLISVGADKSEELITTLKKRGMEYPAIIGEVLEGEGKIFVEK